LDSIDYYDKHAVEYFEKTVDLNMQESLDCFIEYLPEGGSILDLGCGSGRDSVYLLEKGFDVTAMDASEELCELARIHIGYDVLQLSFAEMDFNEVFDGVWACASLLHVKSDEMVTILSKIIKSMKQNGILYMSFKYGEFEGIRDEKYYTDYKTKTLKELVAKFEDLELIDISKCDDLRQEEETIWISVLARKLTQE